MSLARRSRGDDRLRFFPPAVKAGEKLAILHPPVPGQPGRDVRGKVSEPRPVREASLLAGVGVRLSSDAREAFATRAGRPVAQSWGAATLLTVLPILERRGDVDPSCGALRFAGEVIVHGNVAEGMAVAAEGHLVVCGHAEGAHLEGRQGVSIAGHAIGSAVLAGGPPPDPLPDTAALPGEAADLFSGLAGDLNQLLAACRLVLSRNADAARMVGHVVKTLATTKFPSLVEKLRRLEAYAPEAPVLAAWLDEARPALLSGACDRLETLEDLTRRVIRLGETAAAPAGADPAAAPATVGAFDMATAGIPHPATGGIPGPPGGTMPSIRLASARNCRLEAPGNIEVDGPGCFYSTLKAGGSVRIRSVFRGGVVTAGDSITIGEAGAADAGDCEFIVPERGVVTFGQVMPGVRVQVGEIVYRFEESQAFVRVMARDGRPVLEGWR